MTGARPRVIGVRGARTHNLRGIDVDIPEGAFVVVTGPSGSGKSSLAFGTIHAESVRRFASATRALESSFASIDPPDVDAIEGLGVTIGLSQRAATRSARSTVATACGVADPIRRIFSAIGSPGCPHCGGVGVRHTASDVVDAIASLAQGTRLTILAEVARGELGDARETLGALARAGFVRARLDGEIVSLDDVAGKPRKVRRAVDVVVDRLSVRADDVARLREAVTLAYRTGRGRVLVALEGGEERAYSASPTCESCGRDLEPIDPSTFRVRDPRSACEVCGGTGLASAEPAKRKARRRADDDEDESLAFAECARCEGSGFRAFALDVRAMGATFRALHTTPVRDVVTGLDTVRVPSVAQAALGSLRSVLRFLVDVGLGHLSLSRRAPTLSGGEIARVRLAGLLGNEMVGVTYVLDEPTAGLHASERGPVVRAMRDLVTRGNTVLCVEHERDVLTECDHVIELGPGAGVEGGALVLACARDAVPPESLSGRVVRDALRPFERDPRRSTHDLELRGIQRFPFAGADIRIPHGLLTFVTGPSGSGKSTLLGLLADAHAASHAKSGEARTPFVASGFDAIPRCLRLDDTSGAPSSRSFVATRLGVFTELRELFAALPESRVRGFDASTFGLAKGGARCEVCEGLGVVELPSIAGLAARVECERCHGGRFDDAIAEVRYRGLSLVDVLRGTLDESLGRFEAIPKIQRPLAAAVRIGLGHLTLGRSLVDTSGGELVRLRLAAELGVRASNPLVLLDEPTRGLHPIDVRRLVDALDELVSLGATLVVADHALEAIACADHVLDLDVDPGARHARVVATGSPVEISRVPASLTGRALADRADPMNSRKKPLRTK